MLEAPCAEWRVLGRKHGKGRFGSVRQVKSSGAGDSSIEARGRAHVGDGGDMAHCLACSGEMQHDRAEPARHEDPVCSRVCPVRG